MSQAVADAVYAADIPAIAVNSTFRLAPWAWALYAADPEWWQHRTNADALLFGGHKVSCSHVLGVHQVRNSGKIGYSDERDTVHTFGNSGAQALQIAVKAGARRVLLCGFDMHGGHWHGSHPDGLRVTSWALYDRWCEQMTQHLAPAPAARGVEVVNVTPGSALACFRRAVLEEELEQVTC